MNDQQPKALKLADLIDANLAGAGDAEISAELRRLHDENKLLKAAQYGSGRLQELRDVRDKLHAENEDFRATIDYLTRENAEQIGEIVALKEQRDELLAALKDYDDAFTGFDPSSKESRHRMRQAVIKARSAIAKAGGAA